MIDRRRFCLAASWLFLAPLALAASAPGCGGGVPEGQATPNPEMNVDESGSPPEGKSKSAKKR